MHSKLITYSADSQLSAPIAFVRNMFRDVMSARYVAYRLFLRDIKAKYRQTLFGYAWAFIPSIVVAYGLVEAAKANIVNIGSTSIAYPAFVIISMVLWQTFLEAFNAPLTAITESKTMLAKINFPRESIVLAKVMEVFFNFFVKLVLVVALYFFYKIPVSWNVLFAFFGVFQLVLLGTFLGLIIAPLGGIYQDVSKGVAVFATIWFFITPVVYPLPSTGSFSSIVAFNPVTPLLVTTRELAISLPISNLSGFWFVSIFSFIGLFLTWIAFRLAIPYVIERMPS